MKFMHGKPVPVGVPAAGPVCEECEQPAKDAVVCAGCHLAAVEGAYEDGEDDAPDPAEKTAERARDWIQRRKLLFPSEVSRAIEDAFDLFIRDAEDGQC